MKKLLHKVTHNIIILDVLIFVCFIILNIILSLFNIKFRYIPFMFILLILFIFFLIGLIQIFLRNKTKVAAIISSLILVSILLCPIIYLILVFSYIPEHVVTLKDTTYLAEVHSFKQTTVLYYDYYGSIFKGSTLKVSGYFGQGSYDPYNKSYKPKEVTYTYYDEKGNIRNKVKEAYFTNASGKIVGIENNSNPEINHDYSLPSVEEVLYEKKFGNNILRFGQIIDDSNNQERLVNVLISRDNGHNFYVVTNKVLKVEPYAKFTFLDENLGFVSVNNLIMLNNSTSLYVTNDGGRKFRSAEFKYINNQVDFLTIEEGPYYNQDILTIRSSLHQKKSDNQNYEDKELIFISNDNGLTWILKK